MPPSRSRAPSSPRVLVIRRRYLGDIVLLGPVFRNLREHWPTAHVVLLAEAAYAGVTPMNPDVTETWILPRTWRDWLTFVARLRRARFTHVFDFDNTEKTALVTRLTGAETRVVYHRELIPFRHRWCYTAQADVTNTFYDSHHITETYLELLKPAGVPIQSRTTRLIPPAEDLARARRWLGEGTRSILLHPGTRSEYRLWPVERWAAVCDRIQDELGYQVFILAGRADLETAMAIRDHAQSHVVLLEQAGTVTQLTAVLASARLLLCHDSGPMHLAAAVGTPVVALYSSQNSTIWRPLGEGHRVIQAPLPCACFPAGAPALPSPCLRGDSYRSYCVRKLEVDTVFGAVRSQLSTRAVRE